jgi:hypothetical protein
MRERASSTRISIGCESSKQIGFVVCAFICKPAPTTRQNKTKLFSFSTIYVIKFNHFRTVKKVLSSTLGLIQETYSNRLVKAPFAISDKWGKQKKQHNQPKINREFFYFT